MNLSPVTSEYSASFRIAIGARMRSARVAIGRNQEELAAHLGIARQTLAGYEKGHSEPLASLLKRLCNDFEIDAGWLLLGDETRPMFLPERADRRGA
ncbi:MAG: helix-turn-helix transcriptional regulator [Pseudomonadota bacterium]